jgi:hypothetical protein
MVFALAKRLDLFSTFDLVDDLKQFAGDGLCVPPVSRQAHVLRLNIPQIFKNLLFCGS